MRVWQLRYPAHPALTISVNVSTKQLAQANVAEQVHAHLDRDRHGSDQR